MVSQASDNLSQTASNAQDQVASFEANLEERIKKNPLVAVGVAVGAAAASTAHYPAPYYTAPTYCGYNGYPPC